MGACQASTWRVEAGGSGNQSHPWLYRVPGFVRFSTNRNSVRRMASPEPDSKSGHSILISYVQRTEDGESTPRDNVARPLVP